VCSSDLEYKPEEYLYGQSDQVLTQIELEECIAKGDEKISGAENLVMIQCVGCRNEDRNYCSRICCSHAVKNAIRLKKDNPAVNVYILYRDMRTYGFREDYYRQASDLGVRFVRWEAEDKPAVDAVTEGGKTVLRVTVPDPVLRQRLELDADILTLSAAAIPSPGTKEVGRLFKVAMNPDGFFQEAHVKLRPVDFAAEGVFLCGTGHYPKHLMETVSQAYGAAGRAVTILTRDTVTASGAVCEVNEHACESCGACLSVCSYGAVEFAQTPKGKKARVNPILCKGDGLCTSRCPTGAIYLKHFTDDEIFCQIDVA
jgi:heterodisulfide reductase subunit A